MSEGTYFTPPKLEAPHKCVLPAARSTDEGGWICKCGKAYIREYLTEKGEGWWQWKRAPKHDKVYKDLMTMAEKGTLEV